MRLSRSWFGGTGVSSPQMHGGICGLTVSMEVMVVEARLRPLSLGTATRERVWCWVCSVVRGSAVEDDGRRGAGLGRRCDMGGRREAEAGLARRDRPAASP